MASETEAYFLREIESSNTAQARKCWLMTALSILPDSFTIRLQAFRGAELDSDAEEAAKQLLFMYKNYAKEACLFNILCKCISEVQQTSRDGFYASVFRKLPVEKQCSILLQYAEMQTDELDRCKTILFVLSNYSEHQPRCSVAVDFIEQLLGNEKQYAESEGLNEYARLLVCDVLPIVLRTASPPLFDGKKLQKLFVRSLQFCVCSATRNLLHDDDAMGGSNRHSHVDAPNQSWQLLGALVTGFLRHFQCESLANALANVSRPSVTSTSEQQAADEAFAEWTSLRNSVRKALSSADSKSHSQVVRGAVCWTVALLLRCAAAYVRDSLRALSSQTTNAGTSVAAGSTKRNDVTGELRSPTKRSVSSNMHPDDAQPLRVGVLLPANVAGEATVESEPSDDLASPKRAKKIAGNTSDSPRPTAPLVGQFRVAIACWSFLLATDATHKEFQKVFANVLARGEWFWFKLFEIDMCIFHADWRDACDTIATTKQLLANVRTTGSSLGPRLRSNFASLLAARFELQQAACCKQLGDPVVAARHSLNALKELETTAVIGESSRTIIARFNGEESGAASSASTGQSNAYLIPVCSRDSFAPIAIRLVVEALRSVSREAPADSAATLSQSVVQRQLDVASTLLVLSQFEWPRFASVADEALRSLESWLRSLKRNETSQFTISCTLYLSRISRMELLERLMRTVTQCDAAQVRFIVHSCVSDANKQQQQQGFSVADTRNLLIEHVKDHLVDSLSSTSNLCHFLIDLCSRFDQLVVSA